MCEINLKVDDVCTARVTQVSDFGAFVKIGKISALLHISDIAWGGVKHPSEVLSVDQEISVKVLSVDYERARVSVGMKQLEDPWADVSTRFSVGTCAKGKVNACTWAGVIVELKSGVCGCVQLKRDELSAAFMKFSIGCEIEVVVEAVDLSRKTIGLRLKDPISTENDNAILVGETGKKLTPAQIRDLPDGANVRVCEGVTAIGNEVFRRSRLRSVFIPGTVKSIGKGAFRDSRIELVTMGDGVETIGANAFNYCRNLKLVHLPSTIVEVGESAFADDSAAHFDALPLGLQTIGASAFWGVSFDNPIRIGDQSPKIGEKAFCGVQCPEIVVSGRLVQIPPSSFWGVKAKNVVVEPGVVEIGKSAFGWCGTSDGCAIALPNTLRIIDCGAFEGSWIRYIELPNGLERLGKSAFSGCLELESVAGWPAWREFRESFSECPKLKWGESSDVKMMTIKGVSDRIPDRKYLRSSDLVAIRIDDGVTTVGTDAFAGCPNLKTVEFPPSLVSVEEGAFSYCEALEKVVFAPDGCLTKIAEGAFRNCTQLTELQIPKSVADFSIGAFRDCPSLKGVGFAEGSSFKVVGDAILSADGSRLVGFVRGDVPSIPDGVRTVGSKAFAREWKQGSCIQVPMSVAEIADKGFSQARGLVSVVFEPNASVSFGKRVFAGCRDLCEVKLPDNLITLPDETFEGCRNLADVQLPCGLAKIGFAALSGTGLKKIRIPSGVTEVGGGAFKGCKNLKSVTWTAAVSAVPFDTFQYCENLSEIVFESHVEAFGKSCFMGCGFVEFTVPDGTVSIGDESFAECRQLHKLRFPDSVNTMGNRVCEGCKSLSDVRLPQTLTVLPRSFFSGCESLEEVLIPDSVKQIGTFAFWKCAKLRAMSMPASLEGFEEDRDFGETSGESYAFAECTSLREVVFTQGPAKLTCRKLFDKCDGLREVVLPSGLISLGEVFSGCKGLSSVVLPDLLESIGPATFRGCSALEKVTLPMSVKRIGDFAFAETGLRTISIPASTQEIGKQAFASCQELECAEIPKGLKASRSSQFKDCPNLKEITVLG